MKTKSLLAAVSLSSLALPCAADTFKMKDGSSLEATVLSETPESYVLEVQVTKSIKDERTVAKADVADREVEKLDLKAFAAVEKLLPTQDLLTTDEYAQLIATAEKFLKDFSTSPKTTQAKTILATLKDEAAKVGAGGLKVNKSMVTPAQYEANAYELDARVQEVRIRSLVSKGRTLEALRAYTDFEKDYATTLPAGSLRPVMLQVMQSYVEEVRESLTSYDARLKKRTSGLAQMAGEDRKATEAAIAEENAAFESRLKAEKEAKITWTSVDPFSKTSLDEAVKYGDSEVKRLAAVKPVLGQDGGKAYRDAYALVHGSGTSTNMSPAISAAKTAGVPARYITPLEEAAKKKAK